MVAMVKRSGHSLSDKPVAARSLFVDQEAGKSRSLGKKRRIGQQWAAQRHEAGHAFWWTHKTGERKHQVKALENKKHGRPEQSLFRYGLDYLTNSLLQGIREIEETFRLLILFLCPPDTIGVSALNPKIMALRL